MKDLEARFDLDRGLLQFVSAVSRLRLFRFQPYAKYRPSTIIPFPPSFFDGEVSVSTSIAFILSCPPTLMTTRLISSTPLPSLALK